MMIKLTQILTQSTAGNTTAPMYVQASDVVSATSVVGALNAKTTVLTPRVGLPIQIVETPDQVAAAVNAIVKP